MPVGSSAVLGCCIFFVILIQKSYMMLDLVPGRQGDALRYKGHT